MTFELSSSQALAVFSMILGRDEEEQHPTKKQLGLSARHRDPLVQQGFIEFETISPRVERASLTELAWAWAAEHLDTKLPDRPRVWSIALGGALARIQDHLARCDASLASFAPSLPLPSGAVAATRSTPRAKTTAKRTRSKPARAKTSSGGVKKVVEKKKNAPAKKVAKKKAPAKKAEKKKSPAKKAEKKRTKSTRAVGAGRGAPRSAAEPQLGAKPTSSFGRNGNGSLAGRIRHESLALGDGVPRVRVRLRELRARLPDVPRAELDRELFALQLKGALVLYRIDDPTDISQADAAAALHIAGHPRHILYLEH